MAAGDYEELGGDTWSDIQATASVDGRLFIISAGTLYSVSAEDGGYEEIGEGGWEARAMVAHQKALYIFNGDGGLYRVDPATGDYEELGEGGWAGTTGAASVGGRLFAVCDNSLYVVET